MKVVANGKLYDTSKLKELRGHDRRYSTGVTLVGVYQTNSGILVVTDSVWQATDGGCVGITARFASQDEIVCLAERYRGELLDLLPEGN